MGRWVDRVIHNKDFNMDIDNIVKLVGGLGFPIVVAGYLLIQTSPLLKNVNESLVKLIALIETKLH